MSHHQTKKKNKKKNIERSPKRRAKGARDIGGNNTVQGGKE